MNTSNLRQQRTHQIFLGWEVLGLSSSDSHICMIPALLDAHLAGSPDAVFVQVKLKQDSNDVQWQVLARGVESRASGDLKTLTEYFNLHEPLAEMSQQWSQQDARFKLVGPYFPGNHLPASWLLSFAVQDILTSPCIAAKAVKRMSEAQYLGTRCIVCPHHPCLFWLNPTMP